MLMHVRQGRYQASLADNWTDVQTGNKTSLLAAGGMRVLKIYARLVAAQRKCGARAFPRRQTAVDQNLLLPRRKNTIRDFIFGYGIQNFLKFEYDAPL
jgi:hypothetical protein